MSGAIEQAAKNFLVDPAYQKVGIVFSQVKVTVKVILSGPPCKLKSTV